MTFIHQLREKELEMIKQMQELDKKVKEVSWKEKREAKRKHKETDKIKLTVHQLTLAATALTMVKTEQDSNKSAVTTSSLQTPLSGIYPSLPVVTETPVFTPSPLSSTGHVPDAEICGEVACDRTVC